MNHKDLDVWKSAMLLAESVYRETVDFPKHEQVGITSRLRRAAVSVPANIAVGSARKGKMGFIQFPDISLGVLAEREAFMVLSNQDGCFNDKKQDDLTTRITLYSKLNTV